MGLAERRAVKEFQDGNFPTLHQEINTAAGFDVNINVDWDTLAVDGMSHCYTEGFSLLFGTVRDALGEICADDMGKEALKEALKSVHVCNTLDTCAESNAVSFEDGILKPLVNSSKGRPGHSRRCAAMRPIR